MAKETNEELVARIQGGCVEATTALVEQNRGFLHAIAKAYLPAARRNRGADFEDLVQAAALGLLRAVPEWQAGRGLFITLAALYMRNEIRSLLLLGRSRPRVENAAPPVSLNTPLDEAADGDTRLSLLEDAEAVSPYDAAERADVCDQVRAAVDRLPAVEADAIKAAYWGGEKPGREERAAARVAVQRGIRRLRRDRWLLKLVQEDDGCYRSKGLEAFRIDRRSAVEDVVLYREQALERWGL